MKEGEQIAVNNKLKKVLMGISIGSAILSVISVSISIYLANKRD